MSRLEVAIKIGDLENKNMHSNQFTDAQTLSENDDLVKQDDANKKTVTQNAQNNQNNSSNGESNATKEKAKESEQVKFQTIFALIICFNCSIQRKMSQQSVILKQKKQQKQKEFRMDQFNFNLGVPFLLRILFVNITKLMYLISKNVVKKNQKLDISHLPELQESQKVENQYWMMEEVLETISNGKPITGKHVYGMVNYIFRRQFISSHIVIALSLVVKSFNSIIIQRIITAYKDDDIHLALFWAFMLFIILFLNVTLNNNSFNLVQSMSKLILISIYYFKIAQIRLNLVTFLYTKASKLTNHQIQKASIGKLFNLISYDLSTLEMMLYFAFMIIYIPLLLIVSGVILYFRFGGYGLLSILIIFMIVPLQLIFGLRQKKYMNLKNKYSDERIKLVNESVEGIRLMKMYGWEEAFGKYVMDVRKKELGSILNIQLFRASDRGISTAFVLIATFVPILIIYYQGTIQLSSSMIYATLEQLYGLKSILFLTGVGIGFMFQVGLILNRFADFLKLKKQATTSLADNSQHNSELFSQQLELKNKKEQLTKKRMAFLKNNMGAIRDKKTMEQFELTQQELNTLAIKNDKYIQSEYKINEPLSQENAAEFVNFNSFWDVDNPPVLKNISIDIKRGKQYGIVGKVGSGKSTFLQVMLEEIPHLQGEFRKKGSVCYVEQEPYVFSGKLKDNILFGKPYDEEYYNKVLKACCLIQDLEQLPNGDDTEIGERGVNLSGGQKARLSLARAVYSRSDIYLLDDPLSAVDSKVARRLYKDCLNGLLSNSTVLLVTHQIHFTKSCDEIIVLDEGKITHRGKFDQLETVLLEMANQETFGDDKATSSHLSSSMIIEKEAVEDIELQDADPTQNQELQKLEQEKLDKIKENKGKLFILEKEEKFDLSFKTYKRYFGYIKSNFVIFFTLFLYVCSEGLYTAFYYIFGNYDDSDDKEQLFYTSGILMIGFIIVCISKYLLTVISANKANTNVHLDMFTSITRTPILYFDQTPSGRILNKFSSDLGAADMMLPFMLFDSIEGPLQLTNICITVGVFNPWYFILASVMIYATMKLLINNKPMIVQSKQLDLIYKSPVYSFFAKTIQGIVHIRIYKQVDNFLKQMFKNANNSIRTNYAVWRFNRAFAFNQQIVTAIFSILGIILSIYTSQNADKIGQTIVYLTMLIDVIAALSRQIPNLDSNMTSVERVLQICSLPSEDPLVLPTDHMLYTNNNNNKDQTQPQKKQHSWVKNGDIVFQNVQMKYRKDLDLVLKGTSFKINGGERVGCVGRTGAGKSSILQALFRMCPLEQGSLITIDGVDIKQMGLHTLRNSISIIPQIPFVFSGSIRRNLDPLEEYTDAEIWQALKQTDLEDAVKKLPNNILTDMSNAQSVFSTGQKQLICLARAILKNSKILVLDEATANVDMRTDEFIQNAIKEQFQTSTIFTIAHRLNTIADYDKVIVLDQGMVAECDAPYRLLVKNIGDNEITSDSIFAQMVKNTGNDNAQNILKMAQKRFNRINNMDE